MEHIKEGKIIRAKDIFVIRPMKLIRKSEHTRLMQPYDSLARLHLIAQDELDSIIIKGDLLDKPKNPIKRLKAKIQRKVPKHLYDAAITEKSYTFEMLNSDITLGTASTFQTEYADIFRKKLYFSDSIKCDYMFPELGEECVFIQYINSIVDEIGKQVSKGHDFEDEIDYLEHLMSPNSRLNEKDLKILREILNKIQMLEESKEITVCKEETKQYADLLEFWSYSLDINGNKIKPKTKVKIYEKTI